MRNGYGPANCECYVAACCCRARNGWWTRTHARTWTRMRRWANNDTLRWHWPAGRVCRPACRCYGKSYVAKTTRAWILMRTRNWHRLGRLRMDAATARGYRTPHPCLCVLGLPGGAGDHIGALIASFLLISFLSVRAGCNRLSSRHERGCRVACGGTGVQCLCSPQKQWECVKSRVSIHSSRFVRCGLC